MAHENSVNCRVKKVARVLRFRAAASFFLLALLTGCFETKQEFTINPDGTGKVVHECSFQGFDFSGNSEPTEELLKEEVGKIISGSKGVEAWRDVSFDLQDDGWLHFKGTAYFTNLNTLEIKNHTMLRFNWKTGGGETVLMLRTNATERKSSARIKEELDWNRLTSEERGKKLRSQRAKFQRAKPAMSAIVGAIKHEVIFHLPGSVSANAGFAKRPDGTLHLKFEGDKVLAAAEKLMSNDEWIAKNLDLHLDNPETPASDEELRTLVYGSKEPVQATVSGVKPLFDFASEAAGAKKDMVKLLQGLNRQFTPDVASVPASRGGDLKSIKVVGVRLVSETGPPNSDFRPFNYEPGYALVLQAVFPGSILRLTDNSRFETAVADDGTSLLQDTRGTSEIRFPKLSEDKTSVLIEAELKFPGIGVKGLKELSGRLEYQVDGPGKAVELGFSELKLGSKGKELGAQIEALNPGWRNVGSEIQLKLNAKRESLKGIYLVQNSTKTRLEQIGFSRIGDWCTITFESKAAIQPGGKLVAELFDERQTFTTLFKLENISLLGVPIGAK
jgi:hypothetical protein